ncbi:MAG: GspE/PulE family protein [Myxococcota bacterium]
MPDDRIRKFAELSQFELDAESVQMLPLAFCKRNSVVVLGRVDRGARSAITVGMLKPEDTAVVRNLTKLWRRPVTPIGLNLYEINKALAVGYGSMSSGGAPSTSPTKRKTSTSRGKTAQNTPHPTDAQSPLVLDGRRVGPRASAIELTDDLFRQALRLGATDIHLECYRDDVDVRLRIDGVLHQLQTPISPETVSGVVNRLKVMGSLDITERRIPQDGRFRLDIVESGGNRWTCDFRLNAAPGLHGEDIVIRVLGGRVGVIPVSKLGMTEHIRDQLLSLLANPEGLILVTGPTGSGKTTTLYAALAHLNNGARKIITAEDPIEYELPKVNQKQVSPHMAMADLTRAFLRQDPDVLLIGEIRDVDTADVAVRAAATGHVVLSTLHTSDALGALHRMRGLGVPIERLAEALLGVVAQRLLRRVCTDCATPTPPSRRHQRRLGILLEGLNPVAGRGCRTCHQTGYKGRLGIFELLVVDLGLQDEMAEGIPLNDIREALFQRGFTSLIDDALNKVKAGDTSLDELLRVLPYRYLQSEISRREARREAQREARRDTRRPNRR